MAGWARLRERLPGSPGGGGRRGRRWTGAALLIALGVAVGGYALYDRARPYLHGTGCEVQTARGDKPLDLEQGANASTIAAVAHRKDLPVRAAVIAYATAIQESHMRNLPGGDRDSVGMFQQRPSQGWGEPATLRDPVQSTSKFFDALVKVKDYLDRDLHDAAQRVQRSADGRAYAQHEPDGVILARAFTGGEPAAVRCWFPPDRRLEPRRAEAVRALRRAFGGGLKVDRPQALADGVETRAGKDDSVAVKVGGKRLGWAVAAWAVTHAQPFGLTEVRHDGKRWTAESGHDGWTDDSDAPGKEVVIR